VYGAQLAAAVPRARADCVSADADAVCWPARRRKGRARESLYGAGQPRRVVPGRGEHVGEREAHAPRVAAWALEGEDVEGRGLIALTHKLERVAFDKVPPPVCRVQRATRPRARGGARGVGRARGDGAARRGARTLRRFAGARLGTYRIHAAGAARARRVSPRARRRRRRQEQHAERGRARQCRGGPRGW
jgi:hypothetical protein